MPDIFFNQRLDSISKVTRDKWGDMTNTVINQSIPCRFTDDVTKIREVATEDEKIIALVYIGPQHDIKVDYLATYECQDYLNSSKKHSGLDLSIPLIHKFSTRNLNFVFFWKPLLYLHLFLRLYP